MLYCTLDDAKHCTFHPRLRKPRETADRDEDVEAKESDFLGRMEAAERNRRKQLQRTREEKDYNAVLDKKYCPNCGNAQSYDEVMQKRKKCPSCETQYRSKLRWGDVQHEFFARTEENETRRKENLNKLEAQEKCAFRMTERLMYDPDAKCQRRVELPEKKWVSDGLGRLLGSEIDYHWVGRSGT